MNKLLTTPQLMIGPIPDGVNIRYLTGFEAPDPFAAVWNGKEIFLAVSSMEQRRASGHVPKSNVFTLRELKKKPDESFACTVARFVRRLNTDAVAVSDGFPWSITRALRRVRVRIEPVERKLEMMRELKTDTEVRHIRNTQRAAARAMRAARSLIGASGIRGDNLFYKGNRLTAEHVKKVILQSLLDDACSGEHTIVACGRQSADPHHEGRGPLRAGAPIVIDIFPRSLKHGYWGDITRTYVRGKAPYELKTIYRAVRKAQQLALSRIKAGARADAIHREVCTFFEQNGFPLRRDKDAPEGFIHGTGHGVGLDIHEEPRISTRRVRLKSGNVITVEPGLYYRNLGGVRIEDTVLVTTHGWKSLARAPVNLEV